MKKVLSFKLIELVICFLSFRAYAQNHFVVVVDYRDGFWVAINGSPVETLVNIPANAKIVIGANDIEQAGVVVCTE